MKGFDSGIGSESALSEGTVNVNDLDLATISPTDTFLVGNIKVNGRKGEIVLGGRSIHLAPKVMQVFMLLCQHQGQEVSTEQILATVWPQGHASRGNLSHIISDLRHALGDSKSNPKYIETIPRKGYRIVAPVRNLPDEDFNPHFAEAAGFLFESSSKQLQAPKSWHLSWAVLKSSRLFSVSIAFIIFFWLLVQVFETVFPIFNFPDWALRLTVLVFVAGFPAVMLYTWVNEIKDRRKKLLKKNSQFASKVFYRQFKIDVAFLGVMLTVSYFLVYNLIEAIESDQDFTASVGLTPANETVVVDNFPQVKVNPQSIAIMPFTLITGSQRHYFTDNLQTELIDFLSASGSVDVFSKRAVNGLKKDSSLEQIVTLLGARYVLDGQVAYFEPKLIVSMSITDTTQKLQLWSDNIEGSAENILIMQQELLRKVRAAILLVMPEQMGNSLPVRMTSDYLAYDDYMQGKNAVLHNFEQASLFSAEKFYLSALKRDPTFVQAAAALCQTYIDLYEVSKEVKYIDRAKESCDHAKQFTESSHESLIAIADLNRVSGQYQEAERYYSQVLDSANSNKNKAQEAAVGLAQVYALQGKSIQAEKAFLSAIEAAPAEWYLYYRYGVYLFSEGRYVEAIAPFIRVTLLAGGNATAFNSLGGSYYLSGNFLEAGNAWFESLQISPSAATYSNLGTAYYFQERFSESIEAYMQAIELTPEDGLIWTNLGDAEKFSGDEQQALAAYQKALSLTLQALSVNPNDESTNALIAKLYAVTGDCEQALAIGQSESLNASRNPYVFHDLALMASSCGQPEISNRFVNLMIELGYPILLLEKDPAFAAHAGLIKQTTTREGKGRS